MESYCEEKLLKKFFLMFKCFTNVFNLCFKNVFYLFSTRCYEKNERLEDHTETTERFFVLFSINNPSEGFSRGMTASHVTIRTQAALQGRSGEKRANSSEAGGGLSNVTVAGV